MKRIQCIFFQNYFCLFSLIYDERHVSYAEARGIEARKLVRVYENFVYSSPYTFLILLTFIVDYASYCFPVTLIMHRHEWN